MHNQFRFAVNALDVLTLVSHIGVGLGFEVRLI